jgi:hypothetical protein
MQVTMLMSPRRLAAASATLVLAWLLAHGLSAPLLEALAYLLPALGLLAVLYAKRYPGERALLAATGAPSERPPPEESTAPFSAPARALFPRGGRLMGCSLAVRPPPGTAASYS